MNQKGQEIIGKNASQARMYAMMGISLIIPIMIYYSCFAIWENVIMLKSYPLVVIILLAMIAAIALLTLYIVDIVKVSLVTGKIAGSLLFFFLFQPGYFLYRQNMLGKSKTLSIVYMIIAILEPVVLVIMLVSGGFSDILNMLQGLGRIG